MFGPWGSLADQRSSRRRAVRQPALAGPASSAKQQGPRATKPCMARTNLRFEVLDLTPSAKELPHRAEDVRSTP